MAIPFPFVSDLACRIANCITEDIEKIELAALGTKTAWQKFDRPLKAHYADDLIRRADDAALNKILDVLPQYEKHAADYTRHQSKGRPLTTFTNDANASKSFKPQVTRSAERVKDESEQGETTPAKPAPVAAQAAGNETVDSALDALRAALLRPANAAVDAEQVKAIVAAELATFKGAPMRVLVQLPAEEAARDMGIQHESFPLLLRSVPHFPVWLPGPAGSGKTTAARNCAEALGVPFHHHGAVDNVHQLLGFIDAGGNYHRTSFRNAYEHGGVFLWDEVDASNPAALVAFNAAIENGECVFPDATIVKHSQCYFIAAANTYGTGATHEYVGRTKLDAATLDRFVMLDWQYDEKLERAIAGDTTWTAYCQAIRKVCKDKGIKHLVTPRASIRGNALLGLGVPAAQVIAMTVRKGLSEDQWNSVKASAEYRP